MRIIYFRDDLIVIHQYFLLILFLLFKLLSNLNNYLNIIENFYVNCCNQLAFSNYYFYFNVRLRLLDVIFINEN
jgi:hypothetical protein